MRCRRCPTTTWPPSPSCSRRSTDASEQDDIIAMTAANRRFHFAIFDASGMPRLTRLLHQLWDATDAYRALYFQEAPEPGARRAGAHGHARRRCGRGTADGLIVLHNEHRDHSVGTVRAILEQPTSVADSPTDWIQSARLDPIRPQPQPNHVADRPGGTHDPHPAVALRPVRHRPPAQRGGARDPGRRARVRRRQHQAEGRRLVRVGADPGSRAGQGTRLARRAGHAPGGLRLPGHVRGRLRPGLPGAGGG